MEKKRSLVLIDAYSQIFRSFYAIRILTNSRGEPVNAAFVFTKLLLQLEKNHPSAYGAMLFDCGKVPFRLELNPEYKANRPPMPDPLKQQIPLIKEIAGAFGWKQLQCEGFEADDLIGGMALKYQDFSVEIVSSDKDLSQLIDERISMLIPGSSGGFEVRDAAAVKAKFGVAPDMMIDYLALLGDASDNIPGVPGIGPKRAVEILDILGAASSWLDDPARIEAVGTVAKKLLPELDTIRRNRELIRLRTTLPESFDTALPPVRRAPDWKRITGICQDNQFKSILKELPPIEEDVLAQPVSQEEFCDDLFAFAAAQNTVKTSVKEPEEIQGELF